MKKFLDSDLPFILLLILLTIFYVWGTQFIPFHPDESTQLFMSSDFDLLLNDPSAMFWNPDHEDDPRQRYRLLDAPLTRYILGFAGYLTGNQPLNVDWDWSRSWNENLNAGAYPNPQLLRSSRIAITSLLPISLFFIYLISKETSGVIMGLLVVLLIGTQAVILLHGRRAMAEGPLLMGVCFATWTLLRAHKHPWLGGIGMAVAFNAKQSALALLPAFIIALVWLPRKQNNKIFHAMKNLLTFFSVLVVMTFTLNPVFWNKPVQSVQTAFETRADLTKQQMEDTKSIAPEKSLDTYGKRAIMLLLNLYISPPEHSLVGNLAPTIKSVNDYIDMPGHNLFRGIIWGGLFLVFTLFGIYLAIRNIAVFKTEKQRNLILLLLSSILMTVGLILAVPLPWIRFSIPLIPLSFIWIAFGFSTLLTLNAKSGKRSKRDH